MKSKVSELGFWKRIVIVISAGWLVGCTLFLHTQAEDRAQSLMNLQYGACSDMKAAKQDYQFDSCMTEALKTSDDYLKNSWADSILTSIVFLWLTWFVLLLSVRIVRWVMAGKR